LVKRKKTIGNINEACIDWSKGAQLGSKEAEELIRQSCN
jgi:hypothetical protein